jgi:hypothetical protein
MKFTIEAYGNLRLQGLCSSPILPSTILSMAEDAAPVLVEISVTGLGSSPKYD